MANKSKAAALQQRNNATLWALLGVLGAVGIGYFYVSPQISQLQETRLEATALVSDVQAYETRINELISLNQQLDAQQATLDQLALAVPPDAAYDELIVSLESMASSAGIVLATVQPIPDSVEGGAGVTVTARGSYSGIRLFFELLQQNLRPIKATELTLTASSDVTGASLVNASMQLVAAHAGSSIVTQAVQTTGDETATPDAVSGTGGPDGE